MTEEENIDRQPNDGGPPTPDDRVNSAEGTSLSSEDNKTVSEESIQHSTPNIQHSKEMEVHHHGHVHEKKKWKEYLFQFFMLFLAVFCGFLAEYKLEQTIEHHREEQYINSLIDDIKADTAAAQMVIKDFEKKYPRVDSLINSFEDAMNSKSEVFLRNRGAHGAFEDFHLSDGTMQQLKNAGGLRLIRNKTATDSILSYDALSKDVMQQQTHLGTNIFHKLWEIENQCIDYLKIDKLVAEFKKTKKRPTPGYIFSTKDYQTLNQYYAKLKSLRGNCRFWIRYLGQLKAKGERLILTLRKEYDVE